MQAPPPPPPPPPTPPSYPASHPSPKFVESESWWNRTVQVRLIDIIYAAFTTALGFDPDSLSKSSSKDSPSKDSSDLNPVDALLQHPQCDAAVKIAYDLLHRSVPERVPPPDLKSDLWQHNKEKIVMLVVDMCERNRSGIVLPPINAGYMPKKDIVWGAFLPPVNPHDTPARTLPPAEELARQAPMSMPTPAESDIATPRNPADVHNAFSPAESVMSPASARRRRSVSSITDDGRSPKRPRARGPQEHSCTHCGKSFPFRSKLMDHMRIHETTKAFSCPICQKGFKRSREVAAHTKAVHKTNHTGMHSMSPDIQTREVSIQPRPSAMPMAVGAGIPLRPAESATQALFSMPTPAADTPAEQVATPGPIKAEPIDPQTQFTHVAAADDAVRQLNNGVDSATRSSDQDVEMRNGSGDGRPVVKPMYQSKTGTGASAEHTVSESSAPTAPTAPMAIAEEPAKDSAPSNSDSNPPKSPSPKPLAPDINASPKERPSERNKSSPDSDTSSNFEMPPSDPDPDVDKYVTGEILFNAGIGE